MGVEVGSRTIQDISGPNAKINLGALRMVILDFMMQIV
jgi:hypothetical protein